MSMFHQNAVHHARTGQSLIEYGLVIGLIAMVGIASLNLLGEGMSGHLTALASNIGGESTHQPAAVAVDSGSKSPSAVSGASSSVTLANAVQNMAGLAAGVPVSPAPAENGSPAVSGTETLIQNEPTQTHADTLTSAPAGTETPATAPAVATDTTPAIAGTPTTSTATTSAVSAPASLVATQSGGTTDSAAAQAATLFCYGDSNICNSPVDSTSAWGW